MSNNVRRKTKVETPPIVSKRSTASRNEIVVACTVSARDASLIPFPYQYDLAM
jgi:hypothetical protein